LSNKDCIETINFRLLTEYIFEWITKFLEIQLFEKSHRTQKKREAQQILKFNRILTNFLEPTSLVIPNELELIKPGWPQQDESDRINKRNSQFYYVNNKNENFDWKIKNSFVQQYKDQFQIFKLSFKVNKFIIKLRNYLLMKLHKLSVLVSLCYIETSISSFSKW
jgi:hypothetical protein